MCHASHHDLVPSTTVRHRSGRQRESRSGACAAERVMCLTRGSSRHPSAQCPPLLHFTASASQRMLKYPVQSTACRRTSHSAACLPYFSLQCIVYVCVLAGTPSGTKCDTHPLADAAKNVVCRRDRNDYTSKQRCTTRDDQEGALLAQSYSCGSLGAVERARMLELCCKPARG
jgi:hypothetical protein